MGIAHIATVALAAATLGGTPSTGPSPEARGEGAAGDLAWDASRGPVPAQVLGIGDRAAGAVFIGYRGADGETTGAMATLSPLWRTFVRLGAEVTPRSPDGEARFLWGLGAESASDRTFFVDVHDWGPLRPGHLTARTAEASVGYKLPRLRGGPLVLAVNPFAAMPFAGGPNVGAASSLRLGRTWFVATAVGWTLPGVLPASSGTERWRASFALGRWDGRPGGISVTYRDDLGRAGMSSWSQADRRGLGVVAAGVNWSY